MMMNKAGNNFPSAEECISLLRKVGCSEQVICHCQAVCDVALKIAVKTTADQSLVRAGALLHDIGRSKSHGIDHAIIGARLARELGISEDIVGIIEHHIGAGLSSSAAKGLGLPEKDFFPQTLEEKIVCHADNLIDDCRRQNIEVEVEKALLEDKKDYAMQLVKLHKEISELIGMDANMV
jgi:uncharacterized protein